MVMGVRLLVQTGVAVSKALILGEKQGQHLSGKVVLIVGDEKLHKTTMKEVKNGYMYCKKRKS